jgi:DNA primase
LETSSGRQPSAPLARRGAGARKLLSGTATLLDRALWLLVCRCELWNELGAACHDLLADQPAPYGPAFAWLERHLNEHGPESTAALLADMQQQDFGPQGAALAERISQLHEPAPGEDLQSDLRLVVDRFRREVLKDEQKLLIESGLSTLEMEQRYRELQREIHDLTVSTSKGS